MTNLSLDRFRRGNYNMKQQPKMNNSYDDKMVHQLPGTFIAQLCSVLFAVTALTRRERHLSWLSLDWENTSLRIFRPSLHCLFHSVVIQRSLWDEHWDFPLCLLELHQEYWSLVISFKKHHKLKLNIICYKYYSLQLYWYEHFHIWNPANWQLTNCSS